MSNFMEKLALRAKSQAKPNGTYQPDIEKLITEFLQIQFESSKYVESDRIQEYPMAIWCCTDTYVGMYCLFLDEEFLSISYQPARKSHTEYFFVNEEMSDKFLSFLKEMREKYEDKKDLKNYMATLNLEDFKSFEDGYFQVSFAKEIINKNVYIKKYDRYIKCENWQPASNGYIEDRLIVNYDAEDILVPLTDIYLEICEDKTFI